MEVAEPSWQDRFAANGQRYEQLVREAIYELEAATKSKGVKTHSVSGRVKTPESLAKKGEDKGWDDPLAEAGDIVGARVVVLFLSDLQTVGEAIQSTFNVLDVDDKTSGGNPDQFGYQSVHYQVELKENRSGPRYDAIKGISFEIQVRTIVMDAWANVSHYVDYKSDASLPRELVRDFYALAGLFHIADREFERFVTSSEAAQERAERDVAEGSDEVPLNLDTLTSWLPTKYPNRRPNYRRTIADLVDELVSSGYTTIDQLEVDLDRATPAFEQFERDRQQLPPPKARLKTPGGFAQVAAARLTKRLLFGEHNQAPKYQHLIPDAGGHRAGDD